MPIPDWPRMKAQALVITLDYGRCRGIGLDEHPEKMRQRRETVEHPFGTIKARKRRHAPASRCHQCRSRSR